MSKAKTAKAKTEATTARASATPKKAASKPKAAPRKAASELRASSGPDWRSETLGRMRELILQADPAVVEERKWVKPTKPLGTPVFSHDGIVCTGEIYEKVVKLTFMHGASLPDPAGLFNASLEGGTRRAIDITEGAKVNERAFKALIKAAVALNATKKKR